MKTDLMVKVTGKLDCVAGVGLVCAALFAFDNCLCVPHELHRERIHKNSSVRCDADPSVVASGEGFRAVELKGTEIIWGDPPRLCLLGIDQLRRRVLWLYRLQG